MPTPRGLYPVAFFYLVYVAFTRNFLLSKGSIDCACMRGGA